MATGYKHRSNHQVDDQNLRTLLIVLFNRKPIRLDIKLLKLFQVKIWHCFDHVINALAECILSYEEVKSIQEDDDLLQDIGELWIVVGVN